MIPEQIVGTVFGLDPSGIDDETSTRSVAAWDSIGHVTLVLELESAFAVALSAEDAAEMTDVRAIKRVLARHGVQW